MCVCVWGGVVGKGRDVGREGGIWYIGGGGVMLEEMVVFGGEGVTVDVW